MDYILINALIILIYIDKKINIFVNNVENYYCRTYNVRRKVTYYALSNLLG